MKKCILFVLAAVLVLTACFAALAEHLPEGLSLSLEGGKLTVRIPRIPDDPGAWMALDPENGSEVIMLESSEQTEEAAVFVYAPVADGNAFADIWHVTDAVCDRRYSLIADVNNGAVTGVDTEYMASPADLSLDPYLIGEWAEDETQYHVLTVADGEPSGWDLTVTAPMTRGAYRFTGTVRYDCAMEALMYTNGTVYTLPVTDETEAPEDTAPLMENMTGSMFFDISDEEEGELLLIWENPVTHDEVTFRRSDENAPSILAPEIVNVESEDGVLEDGAYWANLYPALQGDSQEKINFCVADIYSGADVGRVSPGEMIFRDFRMYWIDSINGDGSLNYADAVTGEPGTMGFVSIPGSDDFVAVEITDPDQPMLTFADYTWMPLSENVKRLVITGAEMSAAEADAAAFADALDPMDSTAFVFVRDGVIAEIRLYKDVPLGEMMADVRSAAR